MTLVPLVQLEYQGLQVRKEQKVRQASRARKVPKDNQDLLDLLVSFKLLCHLLFNRKLGQLEVDYHKLSCRKNDFPLLALGCCYTGN